MDSKFKVNHNCKYQFVAIQTDHSGEVLKCGKVSGSSLCCLNYNVNPLTDCIVQAVMEIVQDSPVCGILALRFIQIV